MKRILFLCHYNKLNQVSDHVIFTLDCITNFYDEIVIISNSALGDAGREQFRKFASKIIERENIGFDFAAWRDGFEAYGWQNLKAFDSVTLMNDTCFMPLYPMDGVLQEMEARGVDFWGLTDHSSTPTGMPGTNGPVPGHIQSFFLVFHRNVIASEVFIRFWKGVKDATKVDIVIQEYESKLTGLLHRAGFKSSVLIGAEGLGTRFGNPSIFAPEIAIHEGSPFLKIKSFLYHRNPRYIIQLVSEKTSYPVDLIDRHLSQQYLPNQSVKILNKSFIAKPTIPIQKSIKIKTAIYFHVHYLDVFEKYIPALLEDSEVDLWVSTDSEGKAEAVRALFAGSGKSNCLKQVIVLENHGRDFYPFIQMIEYLKEYDLVGKFHTKKSLTADRWIGESWMSEIMDGIGSAVPAIRKLFSENANLGILVPDVPHFIHIHDTVDMLWGIENKGICQELVERMGLVGRISVDEISMPVMPVGTMFWFRPSALEPMFRLGLKKSDFPAEPFPTDKTYAHALERLLVYIVWAQGFDYRVAQGSKSLRSGFEFRMIYEEHLRQKMNRYIPSKKNASNSERIRFFLKNPGKILSAIRHKFKG